MKLVAAFSLAYLITCGSALAADDEAYSKSEALAEYEQFVAGGWTYSAMAGDHDDGWTRLINRDGKIDKPKPEEFGFCAFSLSGKRRVIEIRNEDTDNAEHTISSGTCEHIEIKRRTTYLAKEKNGDDDDVILFFKSFGYALRDTR